MNKLTELTFKEVSYIRAALEAYLQMLEQDVAGDELDDDERIDTQEDILFYNKLLHTFRKAEKQAHELKEVPSIAINLRTKD